MNMIQYCKSLQRAIEIKTILDGMFDESEMTKINKKGTIFIQSFDNCREQGLVFTLYSCSKETLHIAITVHRNSDETRIFKYNKTQFPSNLPEETEWDNDKCFSYDKPYESARYIYDIIIDYFEIGD